MRRLAAKPVSHVRFQGTQLGVPRPTEQQDIASQGFADSCSMQNAACSVPQPSVSTRTQVTGGAERVLVQRRWTMWVHEKGGCSVLPLVVPPALLGDKPAAVLYNAIVQASWVE